MPKETYLHRMEREEWERQAKIDFYGLSTMVSKEKRMATKPPNIVSLDDHEESINLMVYAKSGVGKTVFGGSADTAALGDARMRTLFIAVENGTVSAKRQGSTADIWPVETWSDIVKAYEWLSDPENEDHGYELIVIDSLTQMQQMCMRAILDKGVEENSSRDPDIPQLHDWQKFYNMFQRFINAFCDLPINVLFTALVRNVQDEKGEEFLLPDIQGRGYQVAQYVCGMMSSFGYMKMQRKRVKQGDKTVTKIIRRIIWQDTGVVQGKDRYGVLAPFTEDKTLHQIIQMINGGEEAPARPARKRPRKKEDLTTGTIDEEPEEGETADLDESGGWDDDEDDDE